MRSKQSTTIDPSQHYTIEATYREGAFVGRSRAIPGWRVPAEKRALRTLAEQGYRLTYHITLAERIFVPHPGSDDLRCVCLNTTDSAGFAACDAQGNLQIDSGHSPIDEWDGEHHICLSCGRYFGGNLVVLGQKIQNVAAALLEIPQADIANWKVRVGDAITTLTHFLHDNDNDPSVLKALVDAKGKPFRVGIGGGWSDEIALINPQETEH